MKDFFKKFWHYVLIGLCVVVAGANYLVNDVKPDTKEVLAGHLGVIGQAAENAEAQ